MYFSIKSNFLSICVLSIKGAVLYKLYISDEMWWIWVTGGTWAEFKVLQQSIWILQSTSTSCFTVWVTPECRSHTESESIKSSPAWTTITCCSALFLITGCFSKEKILTGTKSLNMIRHDQRRNNWNKSSSFTPEISSSVMWRPLLAAAESDFLSSPEPNKTQSGVTDSNTRARLCTKGE